MRSGAASAAMLSTSEIFNYPSSIAARIKRAHAQRPILEDFAGLEDFVAATGNRALPAINKFMECRLRLARFDFSFRLETDRVKSENKNVRCKPHQPAR